MNQILLNTDGDGLCRTIKASYCRATFANFINRGGVRCNGRRGV